MITFGNGFLFLGIFSLKEGGERVSETGRQLSHCVKMRNVLTIYFNSPAYPFLLLVAALRMMNCILKYIKIKKEIMWIERFFVFVWKGSRKKNNSCGRGIVIRDLGSRRLLAVRPCISQLRCAVMICAVLPRVNN